MTSKSTARAGASRLSAAASPLPGAMLVPIEAVERDPNQPRRDWREGDGYQHLDELTESIAEFGVLQPLLVRRDPEDAGKFIVIAGGRRLVAARRAKLTHLPVVVRDDESSRERASLLLLQLVENVQRQSLTPMDEARAFQELMDLEGLGPQDVAKRVNISAQHVRDRIRVLNDQVLADAVERGQIAAGVAREISKLMPEYAIALRRRVEAGEKLTTGDIMAARAAQAQAGQINPKAPIQKVPRGYISPEDYWAARGGSPAGAQEPAPAESDQAAAGADDGPMVLVASPFGLPAPSNAGADAGMASGSGHGFAPGRGRPAFSLPARPTPMHGPIDELPAADSLPVMTLNRAFAAPDTSSAIIEQIARLDRAAFEAVLLYGVEQGWTCAGLLEFARRKIAQASV